MTNLFKFSLCFCLFQLVILIKGFVLKEQNNINGDEMSNKGLGDMLKEKDTLHVADLQRHQQEEEEEEEPMDLEDREEMEGANQLMIRMFEPSSTEKEERKERGRSHSFNHDQQQQMPLMVDVVDVDILDILDGNEKKNGEEEEKREIRRKEAKKEMRQTKPIGGGKKKNVKLPPVQRFSVPITARAAPTLKADGLGENLVENEMARQKARAEEAAKALVPGRQFWVNALKTLLLEFRRMHSDIAISRGGGGSKKSRNIKAEDGLKGNGIDERKTEAEGHGDGDGEEQRRRRQRQWANSN